jgi:hypothetical protein
MARYLSVAAAVAATGAAALTPEYVTYHTLDTALY